MTSGYAASIGFGAAAIRRPSNTCNGRLRRARLPRCLVSLPALVLALGLGSFHSVASADGGGQSQQRPPPHRWTSFVAVDGQPEPVPAEWVSTPEGHFAHSLKIPNPVPKDSGYRWWMSSKDYFKHLCDTEAGEFIYEKVENVEGFLFMRPPNWPSDSQLMDSRALEAPGLELTFQLMRDNIRSRGTLFVSPSRPFKYVEEPNPEAPTSSRSVLHVSGYSKGLELDDVKVIDQPQSKYSLTWRGIRRKADRENRIAGYELIIVQADSNRTVAVLRDFQISSVSGGRVWWLSASYCPRSTELYGRPALNEAAEFMSRALNSQLHRGK